MEKNDTTVAKNALRDRFYAQIAEGVKHFPSPSTPPGMENALGAVAQNLSLESVKTCQACPLALVRRQVCVSDVQTHKKIFAVLDFPEVADETSEGFFSTTDGSSALVARLFDKLGVANQVHYSFGVKCHPKKGLATESAAQCAGNLAWELSQVLPEAIVVFGQRALRSLALANGEASLLSSQENSEVTCTVAGRAVKLFVAASAKELETYPEWRSTVWKCLQSLK